MADNPPAVVNNPPAIPDEATVTIAAPASTAEQAQPPQVPSAAVPEPPSHQQSQSIPPPTSTDNIPPTATPVALATNQDVPMPASNPVTLPASSSGMLVLPNTSSSHTLTLPMPVSSAMATSNTHPTISMAPLPSSSVSMAPLSNGMTMTATPLSMAPPMSQVGAPTSQAYPQHGPVVASAPLTSMGSSMAPLMALSEAAKQQTPLNADGKDGAATTIFYPQVMGGKLPDGTMMPAVNVTLAGMMPSAKRTKLDSNGNPIPYEEDHAASAIINMGRKPRGTPPNPNRRKRSWRGWCLTCNVVKELEERSSRDKSYKFQLCNACRKTHLTPRISTAFDKGMARWRDMFQMQGITEVAEPILMQNVLRDLKKEYSNTRMSRILHLYLNDRKETVPITYACDRSMEGIIKIGRQALSKIGPPEPNDTIITVESIRIRGQPYRVYHADVPMSQYAVFKAAAQQLVVDLLTPVIQQICAAPEYAQALSRVGIDPAMVKLMPEDTEIVAVL
eukprot:TRINITY_DN4304_c0_g1_i1.p1 TRINITY_DN4304_c0_g1~~TRINITY_DN4304_c0_g1_i1.p1  ORF type:complete len:505 (+),score=145.78 TRINITY_DN4304_c0_g1_i1:172-1686(+)